jgi:DNA polymerase-3 subunit alpha (Gram-positive type)
MSLPLRDAFQEAGVALSSEFPSAEIENVRYFRHDGHGEITLKLEKPLTYADYEDLQDELDTAFCNHNLIIIKASQPSLPLVELTKYLDSLYMEEPRLSFLKTGAMQFDEKTHLLTYLYTREQDVDSARPLLASVRKYLGQIGLEEMDVAVSLQAADQPQVDKVKVAYTAESQPVAPVQSNSFGGGSNGGRKKYYSRQKKEDYPKIALKDVSDPQENIQFEGTVFAKEDFELRTTKKIIQSLSVFDGEDAIIVKRFEGRSFTREELDAVGEGDRIRVYGSIIFDTYAKDLVCEAQAIEQLEQDFAKDTAEEKRIELHMHSNMSEMDGICEPADIVKYVWKIGQEGVCMTDHADCQSFVKAFNTAKKLKKSDPERKFKIGLGCEANMAEDRMLIVRNIIDETLDEATYVSFDLETTGLSCYFDSIIEFGAVRIRNGAVLDRKQCFIKPPHPIPSYITAKTNITNDMVKDAKPFSETIDDILSWIGNDVLVAHNATFDYNFLNEELRRIGRSPIRNCVIDTLDLARAILPDRRTYRLGNISRYYHVAYDEEVAHRADYDAEALAGVFGCLLKDASQKEVHTIRDLQEKTQDDETYRKVRRSHVNLIIRNKTGLKALYKLITESNTKTLAVTGKASGKDGAEVTAEPRMLRSSIDKVRQDLLIGSACYNNDLFELACNGDDARLEQQMMWYDYIELQPLGNYSTYAAMGNVPGMDRIKEVQKRLIAMAQKLNIPIVATSDAHYCSPEQKRFRDVYITSQGVGGVAHPLYIRDDNLRWRTKNPDQHIRMTAEMMKEFEWLNDPQLVHEIVIDNPHRIFDMIDDIQPVPSGTFPPHIEGSDKKLEEVCYRTEHEMYEYEGKIPEQVSSRLDRELKAIIGAGYYVNYYISHLLVKKSHEDGYVVGSRGSVGSSFTATMAGITEVNPLQPHYLCPSCHYSEWIDDPEVKSGFDLPDKKCPKCGATMKGDGHNIPFETFLGFHGDKVPDIDLNFSDQYQARAHAFTKEVFGADHAFRAGTIGTVADKTAYGYVSGYCEKMNIMNMRRPMKDYLAKGCQSVKRTTGQHPGGIIIIPDAYEAEDFTPVQYPANDPKSEWLTTHYDFHDIHDNVLKFDILGHVDPTAMRLLTSISKTDPTKIPMNDPETLSLFYSDDALKTDPRVYHQETGALGLPEFGTRTTRKVLEETRPHKFSDLVIISGLSHGTDVWAGNAQVLVQQGHPLEEVIGCRDDIMTYLLEKNLESIDAFRIMEDVRHGKGLTEEQEQKMREHDVPEWYIESCQKIKYMFPKAHAVAYVLMAIRIAWYKVHEPWNFYIQFLTLRCDAYELETMTKGIEAVRARMQDISSRMANRYSQNPVSNKEKALFNTLEVVEEMYARGYRIGNLDLYKSLATEFTVDPADVHTIIPPFNIVDGLGNGVANSIVAAREAGEFISKEDIIRRTQVSKNMIQVLEKTGCLSGLQERNQMSLFSL